MSEHQRETEFLRHCLRYGDSTEHAALDEKISEIQRDERCVRRAVWVMAVALALALAGLCYSAVFSEDYPQRTSQFTTSLIVKIFSALGLAFMICVVAFAGLRMVYRMKLDQRREECRQLVAKLLDTRLGKPATRLTRESRSVRGNQVAAGGISSSNNMESTAGAETPLRAGSAR